MFARLTAPKRRLPLILVATIVISIFGVGYASVLMALSNQPKASWNLNPVTITFPAPVGQGTNAVSLMCNPSAKDLHLVATASGNKVSLTSTPFTVASCSSIPTNVKLTAKCLISAPQCEGSYDGLVRLTRGDYYGDVPDNLKVKIIVTALAPDFTVSASPSTISGTTDTNYPSTITITGTGSFTGTVALTAPSSSQSLVCSISKPSINIQTEGASETSTLSCTGSAGTYTVTVTATGQGKTQTATVKYVLEASNAPNQPSNNTSMFGLDPIIFYIILIVVVAIVAGTGLYLGRKQTPTKVGKRIHSRNTSIAS